MIFRHRRYSALTILPFLAAPVAALIAPATAAQAAGDLLVAPTRIVMDGQRSTEVILNNIGSETATYRISLVLRRMQPDGSLEEIDPANANETEQAAQAMIIYAPRRVTLQPNQPQAIRIGIRPPEGLADGEYRGHLLFRAIPQAKGPTENVGEGLSIELIPVYGVTIPIIVRHGPVQATAAISNPRIEQDTDGAQLVFDLSRTGNRSIYGHLEVRHPGADEPAFKVRGIAIYPELTQRTVRLNVSDEQAAAMRGDVIISYREPAEDGGSLISEARTVLR